MNCVREAYDLPAKEAVWVGFWLGVADMAYPTDWKTCGRAMLQAQRRVADAKVGVPA